MARVPPFGGRESNTRERIACSVGVWTGLFLKSGSVEVKMALPVRNVNALPPKQARIYRPRARPEHRQCGAKSPEQDVYPRIVGMGEGKGQLRDRHDHTRDRSPETGQ